jgi:uncharacterized protein YfaS (alpha-2-macroglobulin family)
VNFDIRLPDNITTWKSTIIAMAKHRLQGISNSETKVYKPLQVMSIIPSFLWDQDKVYAKAKYTNLTKEPKKIRTYISINSQSLVHQETQVKNDFVDSVLLSPADTKPMVWKAGLEYNSNYKDEEEREIPVYSSAFKFFSNQNFMMEKDSTYHLHFANDTKGSMILNNTLYEKIIEQINQLNQYEYGCVEQISSKLRALLCKENINKSLGLKENLNPAIYKLMNRLANYQNTDGTWGWWKREMVNWRMTTYAMEVLRKADVMGYSNTMYSSALQAINTNLPLLNLSDKLYAIYAIQKNLDDDQTLKLEFENIKPEQLRSIDKLYYYKILENHGKTVKPSDMYALVLEMNQRMATPYYEDFFNDPKSGFFTAYSLFSNSAMGNEWLDVFKSKLSNGQLEKNLNTYTTATMIEALTRSIEHSGDQPISSEVIINDTLKVKSFPFTLPIQASSYTIKHTGGNVFVNTAEERWVFKPGPSDSIFHINTKFSQVNQTKENLTSGVPCEMQVQVDAYRTGDYVMVEIPIPSGVRIINKNQQDGANIQFYNNKIVVFYSKLSMGQHNLVFDVLPVFKGSFLMPAARCSLMYYPHIYGNNITKTIEIK